MLFPLGVASLPLYLWLRKLGLLESPFGVAIPEAAFSLSITIVILRPFMRAIPGELEDAAIFDGTSRLGFFWRILLPLSEHSQDTARVLAFTALSMVPPLAFFIFAQRRIVGGLTGSIKG